MSAKLAKRTQNPYETLERMLNKTTLQTQRLAHTNIVDLGNRMVTSKADDYLEEHERELQGVLDEAEERATRELKASLKRLKLEKDDDKSKSLRNQKDYYEKLARRVEEQRNRAEEERERELTKRLMREKEEALRQQWEDCQRQKHDAVVVACEELERKVRAECAIERERAVAEALRIAKEKYLIREQQSIEKTRRECEEAARREAERVEKLHQQDIERCNQRYNMLEKKWLREIDHRKNVEQDFRDLQDDYRRFMDYTNGMFHSDYLMQLRHMGQKLAEKRISTISYDEQEFLGTPEPKLGSELKASSDLRLSLTELKPLTDRKMSPEVSTSAQLPDVYSSQRRETSYSFRNK